MTKQNAYDFIRMSLDIVARKKGVEKEILIDTPEKLMQFVDKYVRGKSLISKDIELFSPSDEFFDSFEYSVWSNLSGRLLGNPIEARVEALLKNYAYLRFGNNPIEFSVRRATGGKPENLKIACDNAIDDAEANSGYYPIVGTFVGMLDRSEIEKVDWDHLLKKFVD